MAVLEKKITYLAGTHTWYQLDSSQWSCAVLTTDRDCRIVFFTPAKLSSGRSQAKFADINETINQARRGPTDKSPSVSAAAQPTAPL